MPAPSSPFHPLRPSFRPSRPRSLKLLATRHPSPSARTEHGPQGEGGRGEGNESLARLTNIRERRIPPRHFKNALQRAVAAPQKMHCSAWSLHRSFFQETAVQFWRFVFLCCNFQKTALQFLGRSQFFRKAAVQLFFCCIAFFRGRPAAVPADQPARRHVASRPVDCW